MGTLEEVHQWWVKLLQIGPKCGYHPKKTWLLVKERSEDDAQEQFHDSGINFDYKITRSKITRWRQCRAANLSPPTRGAVRA